MRRVLTLLVIAAVSVAAFRAAPARSLYEEYTPIVRFLLACIHGTSAGSTLTTW